MILSVGLLCFIVSFASINIDIMAGIAVDMHGVVGGISLVPVPQRVDAAVLALYRYHGHLFRIGRVLLAGHLLCILLLHGERQGNGREG